MANEITVKAYLSYKKSGIETVTRTNPTAGGDVLTQKTAGLNYVARVQSIGTGSEQIDKGDVGDIGYCWFHNLGDTFLHIRNGVAGASVVKIEPGEWALFRGAIGVDFYSLSDTTANDLEYLILED